MKWTRAYINSLPDTAFLYVESGGQFASSAKGGYKTHPLTRRHFPYKDIHGHVNQEHLHNALARLHQEKTGASWKTGLPKGLLGKLFARAQAIYSREFGYARAPALPPGVTRIPARKPRGERGVKAEHFMPVGVRVRKAR